MGKWTTTEGHRLPLPFASRDRHLDRSPPSTTGQRVVALVDARTLRVRREAVERVISSGIFAPPRPSHKK
jgi:hypothetical protein